MKNQMRSSADAEMQLSCGQTRLPVGQMKWQSQLSCACGTNEVACGKRSGTGQRSFRCAKNGVARWANCILVILSEVELRSSARHSRAGSQNAIYRATKGAYGQNPVGSCISLWVAKLRRRGYLPSQAFPYAGEGGKTAGFDG